MSKIPLYLVMALMSVNYAKADAIDSLLEILPSKKQQAIAIQMSQVIPSSYRQGLNDYLAVTGIKADSERNLGFVNYNYDYLNQNPCVNELAADFYLSVSLVETVSKESEQAKPKLNSSSKEKYNLPQGWFWKLALEHTQGDKLLAMQLIGLCGHDDVNQGHFRLKFSPSSIYRDKDLRDPQIANEVASKSSNFMEPYVRNYPKERGSTLIRPDGTACPYNGFMYYPGSLGPETDTSPELKNRIAQVQYPGKGVSGVPAKYYHVMGAAYASCFLERQNIPNAVSQRLIKGAINAYRSTRVCEKLDRELSQKIDNGLTLDSLMDRGVKKFRESRVFWREENKKYVPGMPDVEFPVDALTLQLVGSYKVFDNVDMTEEIIKRKVTRNVSEYDAMMMFKQSAAYKASNKCTGPQLSTAVREYLEKNQPGGSGKPCPVDLSPERCANARKVMQTYLVDFEWSEEQHMKGLEFAHKNCPKYDPKNTPEQVACRITAGKNYKSSDSKPEPGVR